MKFSDFRTKYVPKVQNKEERRLTIAQKLNGAATVPFHFHYSGNGTVHLPEIQLPLDLPIYRIANGRTTTYQIEYTREILKNKNGAKTREKDKNFFSEGEEDVETQKAQHLILYALASEGKGESIVSIKEKLEQDAHQTEQILISREGVIINGNRRLAAMRELFLNDSAKYNSFGHVTALVLDPGVTEEELLTIEFKMQMAPESKLPYSWVNEALSFRRMFELKNSYDLLIKATGGALSEKQIKSKIAALEEAEIYLSSHLKQPGAFDHVEQHEEHFRNMQERVAVPSALEQAAARAIGHVLARHSSKLNVRVHDLREAFGKHLKEVADSLVQRYAWPAPETGNLGGLFADERTPEEVQLLTVATAIERADNTESETIALAIKDLLEDLKATRRDEEAANAALSKAQRANRLLHEINLAEAAPETLQGLVAQLGAIVAKASSLLSSARQKLG